MGTNRIDWHSATADAIQITLRDYADLLEYHREYTLSNGAHRIDLLVIHKLPGATIDHPIARHFSEYNLFEIKGISSSVTAAAYYKTIGYAGLLIGEDFSKPPYGRRDVSLTFVSRLHPRKLFKYLKDVCQKIIANPYPGIYNVGEDTFPVQFLVTSELSPETSLYLKCLTNKLQSGSLVEQLAQDYVGHQNEPIYENYMDQLINANLPQKGVSTMCCEGIFKLYGTSSKEIADNAAKEAVAPVLEELLKTTEDLNKTTKELDASKKQIDYLRKLLDQNGIVYTLPV